MQNGRAMTRLFCTPVALLTLALLAAPACSGSSKDETNPGTVTGPSPSPSPSPSPTPNPTPSPTPSGCSASVSGLPTAIPGQGGRFQFAIGVSSACAWTARTDVGWADVSPGSGNGNASPTLNVTQNATFFTRQFTVTVNGQNFPFTQAGANCSYSVDPTSLEESFEEGRASVNVYTAEGCGWTVTASESWIRLLTPTGTGSATIYIELAQNGGGERNASITVAGIRVNVKQRQRG